MSRTDRITPFTSTPSLPPTGRRDRIRWIAFDAGGTLLHPVPGIAETYLEVGRRHGSQLTLEQLRQRIRDAFCSIDEEELAGDLNLLHKTDEKAEKVRWQRLVTATFDNVDDHKACFEELFAHFARTDVWLCPPEAADVFAQLKAAGYRLALASNWDARLEPIIDALHPLPMIELRVISSLVGWRKPSPHFYAELVRRAECAPEEILMVGDDYECDVAAARRAGLQAIHLCQSGSNEDNETISNLRELVSLLRT